MATTTTPSLTQNMRWRNLQDGGVLFLQNHETTTTTPPGPLPCLKCETGFIPLPTNLPPLPHWKCKMEGCYSSDTTTTTTTTTPLLKMQDGGGFLHSQHLHHPPCKMEGVSPLLTSLPPPPLLKTQDKGGFSTSDTSTTPSLAQNTRQRGFITYFFLTPLSPPSFVFLFLFLPLIF